jgi:crossover junction endodeoxyribonuclease RuvC
VKILGIDPGSSITGFGVIAIEGSRLSLIEAGALRLPKSRSLSPRLREAADGLHELIDRHQPDEACLETVFQHLNVRSALVLAHLRGSLMVELARSGVPLHEYTPLEIKKALVGYGHADKEQVRSMVGRLLRLRTLPRPNDVSDALAVAVCHAHVRVVRKRWEGS